MQDMEIIKKLQNIVQRASVYSPEEKEGLVKAIENFNAVSEAEGMLQKLLTQAEIDPKSIRYFFLNLAQEFISLYQIYLKEGKEGAEKKLELARKLLEKD